MTGKVAASDLLCGARYGGLLLMPWARIDDAFDDHPKVLAVLEHEQGGAAIGLWTLCLTWAHRNTLRKGKTPGLLPASLPRRYLGPGARELTALLVEAPAGFSEGLWEPVADDGGWMIHDFDRYLPSEQTSRARSDAGKKGAASRWAKAHADDTVPGSDSKLPSVPGNELELCLDADGKPVASNGTRAHARRVQVVGSTGSDPVPELPVPPTAAQLARAQQDPAVTAGVLVAEWIRACRKRPPDRVIGQVSSELKKLLDEDHDVADIRAGLERWRLVGKNPSTLASFVNEVMNATSAPAIDRKQQARDDMFDNALARARAKDAQEAGK